MRLISTLMSFPDTFFCSVLHKQHDLKRKGNKSHLYINLISHNLSIISLKNMLKGFKNTVKEVNSGQQNQ